MKQFYGNTVKVFDGSISFSLLVDLLINPNIIILATSMKKAANCGL